jgi:hypothetical protein
VEWRCQRPQARQAATPSTRQSPGVTSAHATARLSVRKVVPTLTSNSAEIYLSMAGAKQLVTLGLSWFRPGPYVQQWCARGTILCCTVVLAEGGYKRGGRGGQASRSQRFLIETSVNIVMRVESMWVCAISAPPATRGSPPFIGQGGGSLQACRTGLATCDGMADSGTE